MAKLRRRWRRKRRKTRGRINDYYT